MTQTETDKVRVKGNTLVTLRAVGRTGDVLMMQTRFRIGKHYDAHYRINVKSVSGRTFTNACERYARNIVTNHLVIADRFKPQATFTFLDYSDASGIFLVEFDQLLAPDLFYSFTNPTWIQLTDQSFNTIAPIEKLLTSPKEATRLMGKWLAEKTESLSDFNWKY